MRPSDSRRATQKEEVERVMGIEPTRAVWDTNKK
jgi:hypothetical protein